MAAAPPLWVAPLGNIADLLFLDDIDELLAIDGGAGAWCNTPCSAAGDAQAAPRALRCLDLTHAADCSACVPRRHARCCLRSLRP
jgi:hypothetical protein